MPVLLRLSMLLIPIKHYKSLRHIYIIRVLDMYTHFYSQKSELAKCNNSKH